MRVGFGVTAFSRSVSKGGVDGIGNFTVQLMRLLKNHHAIDIHPVSFGHRGYSSEFGSSVYLLGRFAPLVAFSSLTGSAFIGSSNFCKNIDLFHSTDHYIPKLKGVPVLATIHDAFPISNPEWVSFKYRLIISRIFKKSASWAARYTTVSEYSKAEIAHYFEIRPENISVVPNGVALHWFIPVEQFFLDQLRVKYRILKKYIIFVGTIQPRKNVGTLVQAYLKLPPFFRESFDLVIVGREGWGCDSVIEMLRKGAATGQVRWLQYVPTEELVTLVKGASAMAFPSLAEGFGLPVLEAFAAGVPVVTSNNTSLPEVAGDAAILIDPKESDSISHGLMTVLDDSELANRLKLQGIKRAEMFTWNRSAEAMIIEYRGLYNSF